MTASTELWVTDMLPCHVPDVARLEKEVFSEPWSEKALADSLMSPASVFLVAMTNKGLAGYVGAYLTQDDAAVTNVAVFPNSRRLGIGKALVTQLVHRAAERKAAQVSLEVRVSNAPAIALYESLGFKAVGKRRGFYSHPREDALVYVLTLSEEETI